MKQMLYLQNLRSYNFLEAPFPHEWLRNPSESPSFLH